MIPIPAIDLLDGQCVRLRQGDFNQSKVFSSDPVTMAAHWFALGAERLHLVDLNGAKSGKPEHQQLIQRICAQNPGKSIQVGGGLRSLEAIAACLDSGVNYVILGTAAYKQPELLVMAASHYPGQILVGIDARSDQLALEGWQQSDGQSAIDFAARVKNQGASGIIYTDISTDGMLCGTDFAGARAIADVSGLPVILSGGMASNNEFTNIKAKAPANIIGAIIGRALYEGAFDLRQALDNG